MSGGTVLATNNGFGFTPAVKTAAKKVVDQTQVVLDASSQTVGTAKTTLQTGNTAIETTSTIKKIAQGTFEPAEATGKIEKMKTAITESKVLKSVATLLTENKAVQFVEKSSLGRLVVANHEKLSGGISKGVVALGVLSGGLQIGKGINQIVKGETYEGGWNVARGGALVTSAVVTGPIGIGVYAAVEIAYQGDKATKEYGWYKDSKGNNESAVQHVGTKAKETYNEVSKKDGKVAGVLASNIAVQGQTVIAVGSIVAGAAIKGTQKLGELSEKAGVKVQELGNKLEKKGNEMIAQGGAKKVVGYGAVAIAKTTKTVGVALEKTGQAIVAGAEKAKVAVGQAVNYLEKKVDQASHAVGAVVGKVSSAVNTVANGISNAASSAWNSVTSWF
ncbi:MAG: hypothetical protein AABZ74_03850 [Cyanobacteriota bacterium]